MLLTTDYADDTDGEVAWIEQAFAQEVKAEAVPGRDEGVSQPCHPWFLKFRIQAETDRSAKPPAIF